MTRPVICEACVTHGPEDTHRARLERRLRLSAALASRRTGITGITDSGNFSATRAYGEKFVETDVPGVPGVPGAEGALCQACSGVVAANVPTVAEVMNQQADALRKQDTCMACGGQVMRSKFAYGCPRCAPEVKEVIERALELERRGG